MDMTKPGVQKPHCEPCDFARRACTGCSPARVEPRPSTVVTAQPSTVYSGARHAFTARCLRATRRGASGVKQPRPRLLAEPGDGARLRPRKARGTHCGLPAAASQEETMTVQAPQPPSPQPSFVPVSPTSAQARAASARSADATAWQRVLPRCARRKRDMRSQGAARRQGSQPGRRA